MKNLVRSGLNFHWKYKNQKMSEFFLIRENPKNYWSLYVNNKKLFFFRIYKMFNITKETLENNGIEIIVDSVNASWLSEKNI